MSPCARAIVELGLACLVAVGCVFAWAGVRTTVAVAPVTDGQPVTMSVAYDPQLLLLTLLLATGAGVLAVVGGARLRRAVTTNTNTPEGYCWYHDRHRS